MGATVDIGFDCVGFSKTMSTALGATSSGGKVCLVGLGHTEMTVPLTPAAVRYLYDTCFLSYFRMHLVVALFLSVICNLNVLRL